MRRGVSLDHFAPKSLYPEWTFLALNLFAACVACNSGLKHARNPVETQRIEYRDTVFRIVHPYLDEVELHIVGGFTSECEEPTLIEHLTSKGLETIVDFKLDDPDLFQSWQAEHDAWRMRELRRLLSPAENRELEALLSETAGSN